MGWQFCGENRHGQQIGYGVGAICDEPGCRTWIDRGLGYLCGDMHDDARTCAMYYCAAHRVTSRRCARCQDIPPEDQVCEECNDDGLVLAATPEGRLIHVSCPVCDPDDEAEGRKG